MTGDKPARETHHSTMPGEFDQNYRFLKELINCKEKNSQVARGLEDVAGERLRRIRGKLNRRQITILNQYLKGTSESDDECFVAPVPAELEASIRVRRRSTWLPWEAEAIRKIDRWRSDIQCIVGHWTQLHSAPNGRKILRAGAEASR